MKIQEVIEQIEEQINNDNITGQRRRYLLSYKMELENYLHIYPEAKLLPSPLELFCVNNPSAPECLKYDL